MGQNILVVDGDEQVRSVIETSLKRAQFPIYTCASVKETLSLSLDQFDLMIFDVMMPDMDGFELCRNVREKVDCPILFPTAKSTEADVAEGLALGGDDYIRKPFTPLELVSRVKAHLRREERIHHSYLSFGDIRFLLNVKEIRIKGETIKLIKMEYEICELLARHKGQAFPREHILEQVGGFWTEFESVAIVEYIKNIRKKFSTYQLDPIKIAWGVGYKWE